ncbi:MAG TPA: aminopeptidase P family protein [Acidimicrobiales bacterium]|nr:aminopeptidase P family protein [Acidimicrobiales bacterium]
MVPDLPPMDVAGRLPRLRARIAEAEVDALVVTALANISYLTGFTGSAGTLLVGPDEVLLLTDGRYRTQSVEQVARAGVEARIEIGRPAEQRETLAKAASSYRRLGLEADHLSWSGQRALAEAFGEGVELVPTAGVVEGLRRVKDPGEVARMEAAAAVADEALVAVRPLFDRGPSEAELAQALDHEMRRLGAEDRAFSTIVASGPNGALPHARPTDRRIGEGELVVIDFGAVVEGYCSDMTRTLCRGAPGSRLLEAVVEVVAASQAAGVAAVAAGVEAAEVDRACREVIANAGWADAFSHSTGHGVGLDVHEAPAVATTSTDILEESSVVTVEPGVYLPGHGGVRIEDTVVVCADGCRSLTRSPREVVA